MPSRKRIVVVGTYASERIRAICDRRWLDVEVNDYPPVAIRRTT